MNFCFANNMNLSNNQLSSVLLNSGFFNPPGILQSKFSKPGGLLIQMDLQSSETHYMIGKSLENNDHVIERTFRDVRVAPTVEELKRTGRSFLRPNLTHGAFSDVSTYLDTHFRLYREDFLRPFRKSFQDLVKNQKEYLSGKKNLDDELPYLWIYKKVRFERMINKKGKPNKHQFVRLQKCDYEGVNWNQSDKLLPFSLMLMTRNEFKEIYVATVDRRDGNRSVEDLERGILTLKFEDTPPMTSGEEEFMLVESRQYFGAYSHTLQILQSLEEERMPFKSFIVDVHPTIRPPAYLEYAKAPVIIKGHSVSLLDDKSWPTHVELNLNPMQFQALKACLTQELAIIQGPPGTGKTFMALQVVEICLRNPHFWNPPDTRPAPIVIVCYTNHALDQFLEGVLRIFKRLGQFPSLVRVGRRSESKELEPFKLGVLMEATGKTAKQLVKRARIIGMTTTGAAISSYILQSTRPRVVFVEEAAEVVECHMIPCLLPACEHLILIGDHKQLRPCITSNELASKFHLDISLFERLVNNNLSLCTLNVQHRMRPEIAALLVPTIYSKLDPAPSVIDYEDVLGLEANLFCVSHSQKESQSPKSMSKCNIYEAEFLTALSCYLIQQGYKPSQITVLATYAAQVTLLQEHLKRVEMCAEVEATTVDGFQGKENAIILLSLVRSNDEANIGFLKKDNRVCVALSRAKIGLFMIGNIDVLKSRSKTWNTIHKKLRARNEVGGALKIRCQKHGKVRDVVLPSDFKRLAPDGGCNKNCGQNLKCGHICQLRCHPKDRGHENYLCQFPCERKCLNGHLCCKGLCYEKCPPCFAPFNVQLLCGHFSLLLCFVSQNPQELEKCSKQCQEKCEYYFDPQEGGCGHYCKGTCSDCWQGRFHIKCTEVCNRTLECGHVCKDKCWKPCLPCGSCEDETSDLNESAVISTNLTERIILSNENVMKYFPYVVFYEQQKKSETVKSEAEVQSLEQLSHFVNKAAEAIAGRNGSLKPHLEAELIDRFYQLFYKYMHRVLPWSKREMEDLECEFRRIDDRASLYWCIAKGTIPRASISQMTTVLNIPERYEEKMSSRFKEIILEYAAGKNNPLQALANLKIYDS